MAIDSAVITHPPLTELVPLYKTVAVTPDVEFDSSNNQIDTFRVSFDVAGKGTYEVTVPQKDATVDGINNAVYNKAALIAGILNLTGPDVTIAADGLIEYPVA